MCDELQNVEEIECDDARATRKGSYSAWLKKTKSDNARFKMLQSSTTRYFTIDFDSQLFYYAHSEKQKKMSLPVSFRDILGAERLAPATSNKKAKNRSSGFVLKTKDRTFELYANSAADAAKWTFGLNAARDMGKASTKKGAVEKPESADLGSAGVDTEQQHQEQESQQSPEADVAAKKAKEEKDQKRQQEEAERRAALEAEKKGREDAERRLQELEAKMKAKEAEEAERKSKEEAELRQRQEREAAEKQRREKEEEEASRKASEEAERLQKEEEERETKRIAQEEASRRAREEAERLQKEKEAQEAKQIEQERMLQEQEEARRREQEEVEQRLKQEEAERIAREQEESNNQAKEKAETEKAEADAQNASKALGENEEVEQKQDDAALKALLDASLQEEDPVEQQSSTAGITQEPCAEVADAALLKADVQDVAQDAAAPALPTEDPQDKSQTSDAKSNQQDSLDVCKASDLQKEEPKEQKNEEEQRAPRGKGLQPLQPLKLKPLPKISAGASSETPLEVGNASESAKIKAAEAAPMPPPCLSEPAKEQKADPDASGWDSDDGEGSKNSDKKPAETCVAKALLEVPEGPVKFDSAESAPSGWDSDSEKEAKKPAQCQEALASSGWDSEDETEGKRAKKSEPTKSSDKIPEGPAQTPQEPSGWDDDEDKPASVEAKAKTTEVPATGAGHEPSGWDDEEDKPASTNANKAKTEEAPAKGGMVLEFDMGAGPRKAPPKKLTDRLSKKSVSSKTRKRIDCQTKAPAAAPAAAPTPPSMPPPPKHNNGDDAACGAPPKPAQAFVPARPKTDLTPAAPLPSANRDSDLSDLLTGALATDAAFPSRGGSNSHGFVPNLHCTGCDFQVLRIENHVWAKGGDVSYMFLRNNYPNVMKLRSELEAKKGCSAFCCQCSSRSADAEADLSDVSEGLKWRQIQM